MASLDTLAGMPLNLSSDASQLALASTCMPLNLSSDASQLALNLLMERWLHLNWCLSDGVGKTTKSMR